MPICFDALPQDKPVNALLEKGKYIAKIVGAEMRTPKNGGTDYLALTYELSGLDNTPAGKFWDNLFEVDKPIPRYKLQRLLTALGLTNLTTFELRDLVKVVNNKSLIVDIATDEKENPPKNVVDVFSGEIYYPIAERAAVTPPQSTFDEEDDSPFIDAKDSRPETAVATAVEGNQTAPSDY